MSEKSSIPSPVEGASRRSFFWQGVLFLLPVVLLAGIGLWGLRAQRVAVLEEARQRATEICERVAREFESERGKRATIVRSTISRENIDAFLYPLAPEPPAEPTASIANEAAGDDEEKLRALLAEHPDGRLASGLPLAPLVRYKLAYRHPEDARLMEDFVRSALRDAPSVITPSLLDALEAQGAAVSEARTIWQRDEKARATLRRHRVAILDGPPVARWLRDREALWRLEFPDEGRALALVPVADLRVAASAVLAMEEIPEFLAVALTLDGESLTEVPDRATVLASVREVRAFLTDSDVLFQPYYRQRAWFSGIIAAASLAALAGYFATRRALREQERLNELKSNFVSSVSHELRAPVAAIRLLAERLRDGRVADPEKQREYFGFIDQESRRLTALIGNILDFSRIEQGRKSYEFIETDLVSLVRNTVSLMQPLAEEKSIRLHTEMTPLPRDPVLDGGAIQQALVNLLDNAIKFSPEKGTVTVTLAPSGKSADFLDLSVADRGIGIPASEQARVFERFYRVGSELRRESKGVGIGLSIVHHIAEAHGGKVVLTSAGAHGATFTLQIPLAHG